MGSWDHFYLMNKILVVGLYGHYYYVLCRYVMAEGKEYEAVAVTAEDGENTGM